MGDATFKNMNCIVTAGPTYEPMDNVRRLTNFSTGKLGTELANFLKVFPRDYERMLACFRKVEEQGLTGDQAAMAAFEENLKDLSRIGGN